ncbi:MAG TPA: helix-turn-helix domain-containing protein [Terriglobales bacterium]|nr:helix-turn-helix domain-containing protein [Terriglobales bacterium]
MPKIQWWELPEARQLASLGKKLSRTAQGRLQWMLFYYFNGRNAARTCRHFGISRQTFYRWKRRFDRHDLTTLEERSPRPHQVRQPTWSAELAERVLALRQQYPRWGKDKLVVLLEREHCRVSTSMLGRILAHLKRRGVLREPPRPAVLRQARRKLRKRPWAVRKPKYWRIAEPGDLVEIDTKEIRMRRGVIRKHFSARDVVSRWDVVEVHPRATSLAAAHFLDTLLERTPFPIKAVQVDGGSEFAAEFEEACQQKQLPLFVLPPKSPKLNAHVERSHRTHNEEFYEVHAENDQVPLLNHQLRRWENTYNRVRPHQALDYLTPLEFVVRWQSQRGKAKCH